MRRPVVLAMIASLAVLPGCESMPGRPLEADRPVRPKDVKSFDVLWGTHCSGCHGADGTLGAARPLNDALYLAWASDADLRRIIAEGAPGTLMPAFSEQAGGSLTDVQIDILIDQMRDRWGKPGLSAATSLPPYAAPIGKAGDGARAYQEFCARCHGRDGTGGEAAHGSIVDPAYLALVSDQAVRSSVVVGRSDLGMPDFRGAAHDRVMTDREIADVVAWLVGHRVEFPGQPYADKEKKDG